MLSFQNYKLEGLYVLAGGGENVRMRVRRAKKARKMVKPFKNINRCEVLTVELLNGVNLSR